MGFRLATVDDRAVLVDDDSYYDIAAASGGDLGPDAMDAIGDVAALHDMNGRLSQMEPTGSLDDVELGPPVPRPRNSFGMGLNYRAHVAETARDLPEVPLVFTKFPSCIAGPTADVELRSETADYEVELVVVIGPAAATSLPPTPGTTWPASPAARTSPIGRCSSRPSRRTSTWASRATATVRSDRCWSRPTCSTIRDALAITLRRQRRAAPGRPPPSTADLRRSPT